MTVILNDERRDCEFEANIEGDLVLLSDELGRFITATRTGEDSFETVPPRRYMDDFNRIVTDALRRGGDLGEMLRYVASEWFDHEGHDEWIKCIEWATIVARLQSEQCRASSYQKTQAFNGAVERALTAHGIKMFSSEGFERYGLLRDEWVRMGRPGDHDRFIAARI